jgi:GGDEF domain-containing protein
MRKKDNLAMAALGCVDPASGLFRREHFFIALNNELARLRGCQRALGLLTVAFPKSPDWFKVGQETTLLLEGCDQAARLGHKEMALVLPEVGERKLARLLSQMARELGPARCGLALAWPGQDIAAGALLTKARERLGEFAETLDRIKGADGPFAIKETAVAPAERDSLFQGFGALNA